MTAWRMGGVCVTAGYRLCRRLGVLLGAVLFLAHTARAQDPFVDAVQTFTEGENGGFGAEFLPQILLGPPVGGGLLEGSFDVVALGIGGSIVLRFDPPVICDGEGPDFTIFENAFHSGSLAGPVFTEYGFVAVSQDGEHFIDMPYDAMSGAGLAGRTPVLSHPDNDISPLDSTVSGGDGFDLANVGLPWAAYVRITDVAGVIRDVGDLPQFTVAPNAGFDLDAVAAVHACNPDGGAATPTSTPTPSATAAAPTFTTTPAEPEPTPTPTSIDASATPTPSDPTTTPTVIGLTATPTMADPTPTYTPIRGDLDGDGAVTGADAERLLAALYGDGDTTADVNEDGGTTAADIVALTARRTE